MTPTSVVCVKLISERSFTFYFADEDGLNPTPVTLYHDEYFLAGPMTPTPYHYSKSPVMSTSLCFNGNWKEAYWIDDYVTIQTNNPVHNLSTDCVVTTNSHLAPDEIFGKTSTFPHYFSHRILRAKKLKNGLIGMQIPQSIMNLYFAMPNTSPVITVAPEDFTEIPTDSEGRLRVATTSTNTTTHPCKCDMRILLIKGCQCGGI